MAGGGCMGAYLKARGEEGWCASRRHSLGWAHSGPSTAGTSKAGEQGAKLLLVFLFPRQQAYEADTVTHTFRVRLRELK